MVRTVGTTTGRRACSALAGLAIAVAAMVAVRPAAIAGPVEKDGLKVLPPIVHGNLALFPVVASHPTDASLLLTLDEGIRSGQVTITETGSDRGLQRRGRFHIEQQTAEVNRLVLTNKSQRPLLLLAGEIVTGGKQDRVIGADRIVPPDSGPIDLGVFCVEPGRWVASSSSFGSMGVQMAQPSVRTPAMAEHNQAEVWDKVRYSNSKIAAALPEPAAAAVAGTTSYAKVFSSAPVAAAVMNEYGGAAAEHAMLRELKEKGAVGVVVAINGEVTWADIFADTDLLARYWPKLLRSYVAEAMTDRDQAATAGLPAAQAFLDDLQGDREVVETVPGVFRRSEITGDGYRLFSLTALLPKTGYRVHLTKMRQ